jgi:hypothetical protein
MFIFSRRAISGVIELLKFITVKVPRFGLVCFVSV